MNEVAESVATYNTTPAAQYQPRLTAGYRKTLAARSASVENVFIDDRFHDIDSGVSGRWFISPPFQVERLRSAWEDVEQEAAVFLPPVKSATVKIHVQRVARPGPLIYLED
jgi:hypothetical protein